MCPTPHIEAKAGDFADTVLMPGDPIRSRFIAEHYLDNPRLVNNVRGVQGYTGTYRGVPVSVMASGMGMPSIGIYSYELFHDYDVKNILRVGSAGALQDHIHVRDVVFGMGACTDSAYANNFRLPGSFAPCASFALLQEAVKAAEMKKVRYHVGNLVSSDVFYGDVPGGNDLWRKMGVMAVEMEAAALYMNAARAGKNALAICTISDHIYSDEITTSDERAYSFTQMMEIALETAYAMAMKDKK